MTAILHSRESKLQAISLFEEILRTFMYHGMKPIDIANLTNHRDWMRRQPADLKANCKLETFPATQTTRITLDLSFAPDVKPFSKNPQQA